MNTKTPKQSFSMSDFADALVAHDYEFKVGQIVKGKVIAHESRGSYIDIGGKSPGFLPIDEATTKASGISASDLAELLPIDSDREFMIISDQDADGEVKLSIRLLKIKQAWLNLQDLQAEGKAFNCRVINVNKGGVVADVQGIRGFIPRSHLVDKVNMNDLVGKTLSVVLVELDQTRNKLVLSNTQAVKASAMSQLSKGQLVTGTVTSLRPFGAFIDFGGVTGLLHIKEISQKYIGDVNSVFAIGEPIKAVILDIDESRNRISLSTKILENHAGEFIDQREQVLAEAEQRLETNISKLWNS
ncbi:ribosomal protein S1 [Synechococcus sp. PCC 7502]|uniref:S1 RNA-binding domain-containing protein n=1 Tax=Synechococcus sp. PCC 7502 TaxID=1173263 RepID=UPI00029F9F07|nr:S1 RNA-binding domain-containing protein [Synechococcus sp. PCC 7502]AFY73471.1 ribosomal protein S1 [Synechococcus sp. PCC 7502]